ncbi:MAG: AAA domain-containing protein [Clostridiales bacterium]|jgi:ATP-dependent Clp protease ATP-binding subunit ClpC|nr:AAA domain-containing protein [Clostridiales bacterium]
MRPTMCARCKKNIAVVFITRLENNSTVNEGLCLRCAKDLGIKPVDDMMQKMGLSDEDLEGITSDMMEAFRGIEDNQALTEMSSEEDDDEGKTATFPFLSKLFGNSEQQQQQPSPGEETQNRKEKGDPRQPKRKFLNTYCISLTDKAREGRLDRIVGREKEIGRVVQILNRRQKNNPCLIGEPGVGKTAIAEGLAQRIAEGQVPYKLLNKEVHLLDLTSLVAGTQFRGQFESRMKGLIQEITRLGNIILVIDEVHTIVGAGDAEGSMNAANILKPALSRGEIQVIGATTLNEYRKHIEKDSALERRFQPVIINEPNIEETIEIMRGIAHYYEEYHGVEIPDNIVRQTVILSERYITDRFLPDKAIDLLDEACSDLNLRDETITQAAVLRNELDNIRKEREMLMADDPGRSYERLAYLRSQELKAEQSLSKLEALGRPRITMEHLARVIEMWTKIPASTIAATEYERLAGLDARLKQHIIGQDEAVEAVAAAIRRKRVGISAKRRPVSFIFVGPTGVGKTELVKCVAADLFHSVESLIRLDMSEYMEKYSVSKIIGSPPGYIGYDEAGQLTEKIRRRPYSVILFDEIEKAHPDVMNILLQILDDGMVTDAQGRRINFENTIVIMTSNAGSDGGSGSLGFGHTPNERDKDKAMKALQEFLRPEFINRVDEIIAFNHLTEDNFKDIARLMLGELKESMAEHAVELVWDESLLDYLTKKSFSIKYGARNLRRLIQKEIEDKIAEKIILSYEDPIKHVALSARGETLDITAE